MAELRTAWAGGTPTPMFLAQAEGPTYGADEVFGQDSDEDGGERRDDESGPHGGVDAQASLVGGFAHEHSVADLHVVVETE